MAGREVEAFPASPAICCMQLVPFEKMSLCILGFRCSDSLHADGRLRPS